VAHRSRAGAVHSSHRPGRCEYRVNQLSPSSPDGGGASVLDGDGILL
jgi:hypothetical protein